MAALIGLFVPWELRAHWPLLLALACLIAVSAAMVALGPLFQNVSADRSLQRLLLQQEAGAFDLRIEQPRQLPQPERIASFDAELRSHLDTHVAGWAGAPARITSTGAGELRRPAGATGTPFAAVFQTVPNLAGRVRVAEGAYADGEPAPDLESGPIPVMIGQQAAQDAGIHVGDQFVFLVAGPGGGSVDLLVQGVIAPQDPTDPAFHGRDVWFTLQQPSGPGPAAPFLGLFVEPAVLFDAVAPRIPATRLTHLVRVELDPLRLNSDEIPAARRELQRLIDGLAASLSADASTRLIAVLRSFENADRFSGTHVLLITFEFGAVGLFAIVILAARLAERSRQARVKMYARGAERWQTVVPHAVVGFCVALPAVAVGVPLAMLGLQVAGRLGAFPPVPGESGLDVRMSGAAWGFAALGAGLAWCAYTLPALIEGRRQTTRSQLDPGRRDVSIIRRFYLDVAFLVVALILFFQFQGEASNRRFSALGGDDVDPVLLASPALLLLAVALLVFRFAGPVLRLLARSARALSAPPWVELAFLSMTWASRHRVQVMTLIFFVAAVGTVAATYSQTIDRTTDERIVYDVGADLRVVGISPLLATSPDRALQPLASRFEVESATAVFRGFGHLGPVSPDHRTVVLGIDPDQFPAAIRDDDPLPGSADVPRLLAAVRAEPGLPGLPLPLGSETIAVSARVDPPDAAVQISARVLDAQGRVETVLLGAPTAGTPQRLEAPIHPPGPPLAEPVRLLALTVQSRLASARVTVGSLWLDQLAVRTGEGEVALDSFTGDLEWIAPSALTEGGDRLEIVAADAGGAALRFGWTGLQGREERAILPASPNLPVPIALDRGSMQRAGLQEGDVLSLTLANFTVPARVEASVGLFPTLDPSDAGFLIADLRSVRVAAAVLSATGILPLTEVWIATAPGARIAELSDFLDQTYLPTAVLSTSALLEEARADPFGPGGSGALFKVGFAGLLILGFVSVAILLTAHDVRREAGLLVGIGGGRNTIVWQAIVEAAVVVAGGVVLGTLLGRFVSTAMLGFLETTPAGATAVPPFDLSTDWLVVAIGVLALAASGLCAAALHGMHASRQNLGVALRLEG